MEIRRLGPDDLDLLLAAAALYDRPPHREAAERFLADPRSYFLLASVGDEPAGFVRAHLLHQFDSPRPQCFLYEIGVDPPFQRRGIARALIETLHTLARALDAEEDFVITNPSKCARDGPLPRDRRCAGRGGGDRLRLPPRPRHIR